MSKSKIVLDTVYFQFSHTLLCVTISFRGQLWTKNKRRLSLSIHYPVTNLYYNIRPKFFFFFYQFHKILTHQLLNPHKFSAHFYNILFFIKFLGTLIMTKFAWRKSWAFYLQGNSCIPPRRRQWTSWILDVVIGESATIFELLACEDERLLVRFDEDLHAAMVPWRWG